MVLRIVRTVPATSCAQRTLFCVREIDRLKEKERRTLSVFTPKYSTHLAVSDFDFLKLHPGFDSENSTRMNGKFSLKIC